LGFRKTQCRTTPSSITADFSVATTAMRRHSPQSVYLPMRNRLTRNGAGAAGELKKRVAVQVTIIVGTEPCSRFEFAKE